MSRGILKVIFSLLVGLFILWYISLLFLGTRSDLVKGITGDKIKQVIPGMTLEQVINILGKPYRIEAPLGIHDKNCVKPEPKLDLEVTKQTNIIKITESIYNHPKYCCEASKHNKTITFTYSKPVLLSKNYAMLWVHFDSTYKVSSIYAKRYEGVAKLDDPEVYYHTKHMVRINKDKFSDFFH